MSHFGKQCRLFLTISLAMLALGLALPIALSLAIPSVSVSPFVWNFLQFGGLIGTITFWILSRFAKTSKPEPTPAN